jgi:putative hemolysin
MEIIVIVVLILINCFFALSEITFISSRRMNILEQYKKGNKNAKIVLDFMNEPEKFLSSIQVGITFVGIISGAVGSLAIADDLNYFLKQITVISSFSKELSIVIVVGLVTYFSIVVGELFPKTLGLKNPEKIILFVIPVMSVFTKIFYPFVLFLSFSTRMLLKLVNVKYIDEKEDNPIKEIVSLTRLAVVNKKLNKDQEKILFNTININKIKLHEIMIGKEDIKFLNTKMSLMDAMIEAHIHHHTRYPLEDAETKEVVGYINLKDIFSALQINPNFDTIKSIARDVLYFRETDKVIDILPFLMKKAQHIGMVRDSNNKITGLITLEDIVESIIGDINDEYDLLPEFIYKITETRFIIGGGIKLSKLKKDLSLDIPDSDNELSDWLLKISGTNVTPEKIIKYNNYSFIVRKIKRDKINELILQK